jgi:hypothetical protein
MPTPSYEPSRLARRMINAGAKVPDVEKALVRLGLDPGAAARVVDDVLRGKVVDAAAAAEAGPSFKWHRVVIGLAAAAAGFAGVYVGLVSDPDGILRHTGAWRGAVRGPSLVVGAGWRSEL